MDDFEQVTFDDILLDMSPNEPAKIVMESLIEEPINPTEEVPLYDGPTVTKYEEDYNKLLDEEDKIKLDIEEIKAQNPEIFTKLDQLNTKLSNITEKKEDIRVNVTQAMEAANLPNYTQGRIKITYVKASNKEKFDTKRFKTKYPILAKQFIKVEHSSAYSKITLVK